MTLASIMPRIITAGVQLVQPIPNFSQHHEHLAKHILDIRKHRQPIAPAMLPLLIIQL
jgi:hypothetical protein